METETKKINITVTEGVREVIIREGVAKQELEPKAPVKTNLKGVISVPAEYLAKRVASEQFTQERSHLLVSREDIRLTLVINENDEYLSGTVEGALEFHPAFEAFGINSGKMWTPTELGMFFKMNRAFFPDRNINMKLVTELMNYKATIDSKIERSVKENGDRTDNFAQIVTSNLPESFMLKTPIFKGTATETLEVETFAQINGREVSFTLISPGAAEALEAIRDKAIDRELEQIRAIAPNIAIIEQ